MTPTTCPKCGQSNKNLAGTKQGEGLSDNYTTQPDIKSDITENGGLHSQPKNASMHPSGGRDVSRRSLQSSTIGRATPNITTSRGTSEITGNPGKNEITQPAEQGFEQEAESILSMVWNDGAQLAGGAYLNAPHLGMVDAVPAITRAHNAAVVRELEHILGFDTKGRTTHRQVDFNALAVLAIYEHRLAQLGGKQ